MRIADGVKPQNMQIALVGSTVAFERFNGCGLACAIGTQQCEDFSLVYSKCYMVDDSIGAVTFREVLNDNGFTPRCLSFLHRLVRHVSRLLICRHGLFSLKDMICRSVYTV